MKHTPEPWLVWELSEDSDFRERNILTTSDGDGEISGVFYKRADAERAAACVNALAGINDPAGFVKRQQDTIDELFDALGQATADRLLAEAELIEVRSDKYIEAFERNSLRLAEANLAALTYTQTRSPQSLRRTSCSRSSLRTRRRTRMKHTPEPWQYEPAVLEERAAGIRAFPASIFADVPEGYDVALVAVAGDCEYKLPHDQWTDTEKRQFDADDYYDPQLGMRQRGDPDANMQRIVACVNALAGIDDPAAFVVLSIRCRSSRSGLV